MRRLQFLLVALLAFAGVAAFGPARAATEAPFTQAAFVAAQNAGKPILIEVHASWCPTCAKQRPILSKLWEEPAFKDVQVFKVDFDTQKDVLRQMRVQMQSTLIAFHGATEQARATGITDANEIRALVTKTQS